MKDIPALAAVAAREKLARVPTAAALAADAPRAAPMGARNGRHIAQSAFLKYAMSMSLVTREATFLIKPPQVAFPSVGFPEVGCDPFAVGLERGTHMWVHTGWLLET
jgi:hypothetical protein